MVPAPLARLVRACAVTALLVVPAPVARAACTGMGAGLACAAGASPQAVASADFDGDGIADLVVANLSGASLCVLRGTGGGAFAAPVAWIGGTAGRAVATGDFNGDGNPDVAVAVSDGVATWLGGGGTFTGGAVTPAGSALRGIVCGDFDRDGITDLAVTSSSTNQVLLLRGGGANGVGDGSFRAPEAYAVGLSPARLVAADVSGDGILDLVVANNGGASISILLGRGAAGVGNGTFQPAVTYAVAGSPWGVAALDWSGDGVTDLLVSNGAGSTIALMRGTGGGAFAAAGAVTTPVAPRDLVVGDFDGDGVADVAAACAVGNVVCVLHGTGSGFTVLNSFAAGSGAAALAAGDWNSDGAPDLVCANAGAGTVTRLLGTCPAPATARVTLLSPRGGETWWPGTAQQARWTRGAGVTGVDVDLSRDGGLTWLPLAHDLAAVHLAVPAVGVPGGRQRVRVRDTLVPARADASPADFTLCGLLGVPILSVAGLPVSAMATADLDGDDRPDLVVAGGSRVGVLRGDGAGEFVAGGWFPADSTRRLALGDVNGDGLVDLVRLTADAIATREGDGAGGFGPETRIALAGGTGLAVADLDGDGRADVAVLAADLAGARLVVLQDGSASALFVATQPGAPGALVCADLDGDGVPDLAAASGTTLQMWMGQGSGGRGDGTFRAGGSRALPEAAGDLVIADSNGDGVPEITACLPATGDLVTLAAAAPGEGASVGAVDPPLAIPAGAGPCSPVVADLDGDGHPDFVLALAKENAIGVIAGGGTGAGTLSRFAGGGGTLVVDDFNRDGHPDVAIAGADGIVRCLVSPCPPQLPAAVTLDPAVFADTSAALAGFARRVAWTRSASVPALRVELSRDGGAHWTTLAEGVTGDAFTWSASGTPTSLARLRVRDASCGSRRDTGAPFAIRAPYSPAAASASLPAAHGLATADVDGDGAADAIVAAGDAVQVLRGTGEGGFSESARWADAGVRRVDLEDLDADGAVDALSLHADRLVVWPGDGAGGFAEGREVALDGGVADLVVADVDADGLPDLVTVCGSGPANRVSVRLGRGRDDSGSPAFSGPWYASLPATPSAMAIADLNGDGIADLVVAHAAGVATLLGGGAGSRGNGTFHLAGNRSLGGMPPRALVTGDLDGDGHADVAYADSAARLVRLAPGDGAGGLGAPVSVTCPGAPMAVALADVDRDGAMDLVIALADGRLALARGVAGAPLASRFAPAGVVSSGGAGAALALLDADGDGVADAVVLDPAGSLRVLRGGSAAAGAPRLLAGPPAAVKLGDAVALRWTTPPGLAGVDVELSRDRGERWTRIARAIPGGAWTWIASGPPTGVAELRVRDAQAIANADTTSATFVISPTTASVVVPDPHAGARLGAAHPNPARAGTRLELVMGSPGAVRVVVGDVAGRRVRRLFDGTLGAGTHTISWDGADDAGSPLPPGLYFVQARVGSSAFSRRVVIAH